MPHKLSQVVAVEKPLKQRVERQITDINKQFQKPDLFDGFRRTYQPLREDGEQFPPETKVVQLRAIEQLQLARKALGELWTISYQRDVANCSATADIVIGGRAVMTAVPAVHLLYLEKQLNDLHTLVANLPTLDPAEVWTQDTNAAVHRTAGKRAAKTKKIMKPIVLIEPTKEHPGKAELISEDDVVGYWDNVRISGAVPQPQKQRLLERVEEAQRAVKYAREEANRSPAPEDRTEALLDWIFA